MKQFDSSEYIRKTYRQYLLRMNKQEDARIIEKLDSVQSYTSYIRDLVAKDLQAEQKPERRK